MFEAALHHPVSGVIQAEPEGIFHEVSAPSTVVEKFAEGRQTGLPTEAISSALVSATESCVTKR